MGRGRDLNAETQRAQRNEMETGGPPVLRLTICILLFIRVGFSTNRVCEKTYGNILGGSGCGGVEYKSKNDENEAKTGLFFHEFH